MRITFVTRNFGNVERNSHCDVLHIIPIRVVSLFLDCNGDFAIKAYSLVVCMWLLASNTTDVNDLRYQLFCAKRGEIESSMLLPCRDCLFMHLLRANYQAAIWKCCLHARPTVPDPTKCGLIDDDGKLTIHWMRSPPAPDAVLELLACKCVRSGKLSTCTCMAHGLACTDMCKLLSCSNQKQQEDEDDIVELDDTDDDIDVQVDV